MTQSQSPITLIIIRGYSKILNVPCNCGNCILLFSFCLANQVNQAEMPVDINMEMSGSRANICIYKACRLPIIQRRENQRIAKMHVYIFSDVHQESIDPRKFPILDEKMFLYLEILGMLLHPKNRLLK